MKGGCVFPVAVWFDNDLDILPKRHKETQQAFDRKLPKLPAQHFGDIGLANAKQTCGFDLFQAALFHNRVNLQHQLRLDKMLVGMGKAEVSEDIVASCFIICVAHGFLSLAICSASRKRCFTSAISRFGVSRPVFDFFWKACSTYTAPA